MTVDIAQWTVETLRDDMALARLRDDWDDLYGRCSRATPFQSHAWLESWWRSYGTPGGLMLTLVRRSGQLVAAAALVRGWRGVGVLTFAGAGVSDYGDVLVDDSCAEEAAPRLGRAIADEARRHVVDLAEVRPGAAVWRIVAGWPGRAARLPASICLELPGVPLDDVLRGLPTRTARRRRREVRKLEETGIEARTTAPEYVAGMVHQLLLLHRRQWRGRGMTPEHGRARFADHLSRSLPVMARRGQAEVVGFYLGDRLVAANILLISQGMVGAYLYGIDPELRKSVDVVAMVLNQDLVTTLRWGRPVLSLMRGDEEYKQRWRPRKVRSQRILLTGLDPRGRLYVAAVQARTRLVPFVKQRLPVVHRTAKRVRTWFTSCT
jgi:CelD/BcsL family acetyltransferase involved in cellulose biosynthesis